MQVISQSEEIGGGGAHPGSDEAQLVHRSGSEHRCVLLIMDEQLAQVAQVMSPAQAHGG